MFFAGRLGPQICVTSQLYGLQEYTVYTYTQLLYVYGYGICRVHVKGFRVCWFAKRAVAQEALGMVIGMQRGMRVVKTWGFPQTRDPGFGGQ